MRDKLPDRRPNVTCECEHELASGKCVTLLVTVGFDAQRRSREVFCANFKAGTDLYAVVTDACILLSRLLQMEMSPQEILASLGSPPSLIGTLARAVCEAHLERMT